MIYVILAATGGGMGRGQQDRRCNVLSVSRFAKCLVRIGCTINLGFLFLLSHHCDMLCNSQSTCNSLSALICITALGGDVGIFTPLHTCSD